MLFFLSFATLWSHAFQSFSVSKLVLRKQYNNSFMLICKCKCKNLLLLLRYLHFNGCQTLRMKQGMSLYFILRQFSRGAFLGAWKEAPPRCIWNASPLPSLVSWWWGCSLHRSQWLALALHLALCLRATALLLAHWRKLSFSLLAFPWPSPWEPSKLCASSKFRYFQRWQKSKVNKYVSSSSMFSVTISPPQLPGHYSLLLLYHRCFVHLYRVLYALYFHFSSYLLEIH